MANRSNCKTSFGKLAFVVALSGLIGCSQQGPQLVEVEGIVNYKGQPVTQGTIHLGPAEGSSGSRPGVGNIDAAGRYTIRSLPGREGIAPGTYNVTIQSYTGSHLEGNVKYLVPQRYTDPQKSGLTLDVPADKSSLEKNFDLE
jgi:hypothetical protein